MHVTAVAFAVQGVAVVVLLAAGSSAAGAVAFVLLFGLGFGVGTIARPALLAEAFGTASYATLSALGGVAFTAAKTVGPFAAGVALTTGDVDTGAPRAARRHRGGVGRRRPRWPPPGFGTRPDREGVSGMNGCCDDDAQCCDTGCC